MGQDLRFNKYTKLMSDDVSQEDKYRQQSVLINAAMLHCAPKADLAYQILDMGLIHGRL